VIAVTVAALAAAPGAHAATVRVAQINEPSCSDAGITVPELVYKGGIGEVNKVSVLTVGAGFIADPIGECASDPAGGISTNLEEIVTDPGARKMYAGKGCTAIGRTIARCNGASMASIVLGDRNDYLAVDAFPDGSTILGGPGDDSIHSVNGAIDTVICGDGSDTVVADRDQVAPDCENVTD
jgi:hypothetical protein